MTTTHETESTAVFADESRHFIFHDPDRDETIAIVRGGAGFQERLAQAIEDHTCYALVSFDGWHIHAPADSGNVNVTLQDGDKYPSWVETYVFDPIFVY